MDTSEPTSTAEGEEQCKEMDAAAKHLLRMVGNHVKIY